MPWKSNDHRVQDNAWFFNLKCHAHCLSISNYKGPRKWNKHQDQKLKDEGERERHCPNFSLRGTRGEKPLPAGTCCLGGVFKSGRSSLNETDFSKETDFSEMGKSVHHSRHNTLPTNQFVHAVYIRNSHMYIATIFTDMT